MRREHAIDAMTMAVRALRDDVSQANADHVFQTWEILLTVIGDFNAQR